ncbi:MAG TPA: cytochrome c [Opitutaceae bacterium]|nr:cytochrome c [Opitutaceae bacterium]
MKRVLKLAGYGLVVLIALVAALAAFVTLRSNAKLRKTFAVTVQPVAVPTDAAAIARGRHVAETRGCAECHGKDLAGATVFENGAMGRVDGPNLTRGAGGAGARFSDLDFVRAIRHGVAPDGRGLFLMPSTDFAAFSDDDMGALIAYVKSVPPVDKPNGPVKLGPVARALLTFGQIKLAAEEIDHANVHPAMVKPAATADYGRYLAAGCTGCHGSNFSGGKIKVGPPDWPPAANLTPHPDGRIAKWSEADFIAALRTAKRPDGTELNPVMPRAFAALDDVELKALWAFLKTLPAAATGSHD